MHGWDKPDNNTNTIGYLTLYTDSYDGEMTDFTYKFDWDDSPKEISTLQDYFEDMAEKYEDNEEVLMNHDLVGLNSTSFMTKRHNHNLFLEWDSEHYVPEMHVLEAFDGMLVETDGGIHLIKEASLTTSELIHQMKRWNCCPGFTSYSEQRLHSCLRICPKGSNRLKILNYKEGFLYSVYEELVESLENYV